MIKNSITEGQRRILKIDRRNIDTPFKVVASGVSQPQRFENLEKAQEFFNKHYGRCLMTFNTDSNVTFLAYKYRV